MTSETVPEQLVRCSAAQVPCGMTELCQRGVCKRGVVTLEYSGQEASDKHNVQALRREMITPKKVEEPGEAETN